jgi:hypothetical protein
MLRHNSRFIKKVKDYETVNEFEDDEDVENNDESISKKENGDITNKHEKRVFSRTRYSHKVKKVIKYGL